MWQVPSTGRVWALQVVWHVRTRMHARTTVLFSQLFKPLGLPIPPEHHHQLQQHVLRYLHFKKPAFCGKSEVFSFRRYGDLSASGQLRTCPQPPAPREATARRAPPRQNGVESKLQTHWCELSTVLGNCNVRGSVVACLTVGLDPVAVWVPGSTNAADTAHARTWRRRDDRSHGRSCRRNAGHALHTRRRTRCRRRPIHGPRRSVVQPTPGPEPETPGRLRLLGV